ASWKRSSDSSGVNDLRRRSSGNGGSLRKLLGSPARIAATRAKGDPHARSQGSRVDRVRLALRLRRRSGARSDAQQLAQLEAQDVDDAEIDAEDGTPERAPLPEHGDVLFRRTCLGRR